MINKSMFHVTHGENKTSVVIATKPHLTNLIATLNEKLKKPDKAFYFNPANGSSFYYSPVLDNSKIKSLKSFILLENPLEAASE